MTSPGECFLSPLLRVLPDVGEGRGAGIVATDFIKAGTLLARQHGPLVWSTRVAPDCPGGLSGAASGAPSSPTCPTKELGSSSTGNNNTNSNSHAVTSCDGCLCPYDHIRNIYPAAGRRAGASAKRCSACKVVSYCSTECQRSAWNRHKKECALFNHVRKASAGRGPNLTQRLVLRLLLNGHSLEEFSGGHTTAGSAAAREEAKTETVPSATASAKDELSARPQCECSKKERCSRSAALSDHLKACSASAALLEELLRSAETLPGGLQSLGLHALPRPGEIAVLLDRLSANVHSITHSGDPKASGAPPSGACPCCDIGKEVAVGIYGQPLCRFNHSCFPNAAIVFGGPQGALEIAVVASRSIICGEEVCVSYASPAAVRQERRNKLYLAYAFTCTCVLCCSCSESMRNSSSAITHGNNICNNNSNSEYNEANAADSSSNGNDSSNNNGNAELRHRRPFASSPAEAFDLQLRAVFCPKASCASLRSTADANALLDLESASQEYFDSSCQHRKAQREEFPGVSDSNCAHAVDPRGRERAAQRRRLHMPVLCIQKPGQDIWEPIQICTGDANPQKDLKRGASTLGKPTIRLVPEELEHLPSGDENTHATPLPDIRCRSCGDAYELGDVVRVLDTMRNLEDSAERLAQACCTEASEAIELEGRAVLKLFCAVRAYAHPGNLFLLNVAESLNRSCGGLVALYNGIGLAVSQHLSRAAAALHGQCSTQHADLLLTEGSLLHFLSQADTEEEALQAWSLWAEGDPATAAARSAAGTAAGAYLLEGGTGSETRAKLVLQARECLLQACSIFFSYEGCCAERQKGRTAEGRIADCERELQALGFTC